MLSEEALVLVAAILACGLLTLGVLELLAPTRPRLPRRPVARNPFLPPRAAPLPASHREERPPSIAPTPPVTASSPSSRAPVAHAESSSVEPPIERLLRSQAASLEPPRRLPPSPPPAPPSAPSPPRSVVPPPPLPPAPAPPPSPARPRTPPSSAPAPRVS